MSRKKSFWERWTRTRPKPVSFLVVVDALLLGAALLIFAFFHHVLPREEQVVGTTSTRGGTSVATEGGASAITESTPAPTAAPVTSSGTSSFPAMPAPVDSLIATDTGDDPVGYFGNKYADKFITGEAQYTETDTGFTYVSQSVNLTFTRYQSTDLVYYVADFYVKDITNYKTALANDKFGTGQRESVASMAQRNGALLAVNGDYYSHGSNGITIRNGTLYRDTASENDICALFWDGTMKTYDKGEITGAELIELGAYQAWDFGPAYLDAGGNAKTSFNSNVGPKNPRTVLGYFEPGHYCIVCIDGRGTSKGLTNTETSALMASLGCLAAYNLDGGQTTVMTWQGEIINVPYKGGRQTSDIVMLTD